jgi:TolB-like protein
MLLLSISYASNIALAQDKSSIAVLPLEESGISSSEARVLTDELRSVLVQSGNYIVLERNNMESILQEQGFQLSGCTSTECAVEAGKLLGVEKMVTGSVGKIGELYNINVRLFDVGTGQIENTVSQKHEGSVEDLLDVINQVGIELASTSSTSGPAKNIEKGDLEKDGRLQEEIQDAPHTSGNRIGLWLGINFPRTSSISEVGKGFRAGIYYRVHLLSHLYLHPELSYVTSVIEYYEPEDILKFEYIQIPLLLSYEIISSDMKNIILILEAGPAYNSILSAQEEYEGYTSDMKSYVNDSYFSVILGVSFGIRFGKTIGSLGIRYERGLNTIFKDDVLYEVGKTQAFFIIAGVSF